MKIGYYDDGQATRKVEIIDETTSGKYLCCKIGGSGYSPWLHHGRLIILLKEEIFDIKEYEENAGTKDYQARSSNS